MPEVRLVGPQGEQVGIVRIEDALRMALQLAHKAGKPAPRSRGRVHMMAGFLSLSLRAADKAMQVLASAGYRRGSTVERLARDARAAETKPAESRPGTRNITFTRTNAGQQ